MNIQTIIMIIGIAAFILSLVILGIDLIKVKELTTKAEADISFYKSIARTSSGSATRALDGWKETLKANAELRDLARDVAADAMHLNEQVDLLLKDIRGERYGRSGSGGDNPVGSGDILPSE